LLVERAVSGVVMIVVMTIAFVAGLVGFAVHVAWVVAVVVLALGLGYVVANSRKDRVETLDRRDDPQATT
jgi:membrane protein implicated in regulation of membrane protease activity